MSTRNTVFLTDIGAANVVTASHQGDAKTLQRGRRPSSQSSNEAMNLAHTPNGHWDVYTV